MDSNYYSGSVIIREKVQDVSGPLAVQVYRLSVGAGHSLDELENCLDDQVLIFLQNFLNFTMFMFYLTFNSFFSFLGWQLKTTLVERVLK